MKVIATIGTTKAKSWQEDIDCPLSDTLDEARLDVQEIVDRFNNTLRPGDKKRKLLHLCERTISADIEAGIGVKLCFEIEAAKLIFTVPSEDVAGMDEGERNEYFESLCQEWGRANLAAYWGIVEP